MTPSRAPAPPARRESPSEHAATQSDAWRKLELAFAASIAVLLVVLHVSLFFHAGPLWRDEVNAVNVASQPSVSGIFGTHQYDSSFMLWYLLVRGWAVLFGWADPSIRAFGLGIGLATVAMLWWAARELGRGVPVISSVTFGLAPVAIFYGDSLRGYGASVLFLLLTTALLWRWMRRPTPGRLVAALVAAVAGVHVMSWNAVLLLGVGVGAAAAGAALKDRSRTLWPLGIGLIAGVSLLPYLATARRMAAWIDVLRHPLRSGNPLSYLPLSWLWAALLAIALAAALICLFDRRRHPQTPEPRPEPAWLVAVGLPAGVAAYALAAARLGYVGPIWQFIPLLAFLSILCDLGVERLAAGRRLVRPVRLLAAAALALLLIPSAWSAARQRHTNVDLIAEQLNGRAGPHDLIVVTPWYVGISFDRYYRGQAPWLTVPPIEDRTLHRWDLIRERLADPDPIGPVIQRCRETVESGGSVYVVLGRRGEERVTRLQPAPHPYWGWYEAPYVSRWQAQVLRAVGELATSVEVPGSATPVDPLERLELMTVTASAAGP